MDRVIATIASEMMRFNKGDTRRIEHSIKVFSYAQIMGRLENLGPNQQLILEITALLHDIGIQAAEKKLGHSTAKLQESEGPPVARQILESLGISEEVITRVCFIIGHHHTLTAIDDIVFQLLVEADFLVNSVEDEMDEYQVNGFSVSYFKTVSGHNFLKMLFSRSC